LWIFKSLFFAFQWSLVFVIRHNNNQPCVLSSSLRTSSGMRKRPRYFELQFTTSDKAYRKLRKLSKPTVDEAVHCKVANVVSTVQLIAPSLVREKKASLTNKGKPFVSFDLRSVANHVPTSKYNKKEFAACIPRICGNTTALVFSNGNVVVVSGSTEMNSLFTSHMYRLFIEEVPMLAINSEGQVITQTFRGRLLFHGWKVQNIVASASMGTSIDLDKLSSELKGLCVYQPELFPGLMMRMQASHPDTNEKKKIQCLLFHTGKVLVIGSQDVRITNNVTFLLRKFIRKKYKQTIGERITSTQDRLSDIFNDDNHLRLLQAEHKLLYEYKETNKKSHRDMFREKARKLEEERKLQQEIRNEKIKVKEVMSDKQLITKSTQRKLIDQIETLNLSNLMIATILGQVENVMIWIRTGADIQRKDTLGHTAFYYASTIESPKHKEIKDILDKYSH